MRVLLDTIAFYVAAGVSDLTFSSKVQHLLKDPANKLYVSTVSFTEIAIKTNKGLTPITRGQIEMLIDDLDLTVMPLTAEHAWKMFGLPPHHNDPFDRMLISIALAEDIPLVANDREFRKYNGLRVIW